MQLCNCSYMGIVLFKLLFALMYYGCYPKNEVKAYKFGKIVCVYEGRGVYFYVYIPEKFTEKNIRNSVKKWMKTYLNYNRIFNRNHAFSFINSIHLQMVDTIHLFSSEEMHQNFIK